MLRLEPIIVLRWGEQFSKVPLLLSPVSGEFQFLTFYHLLSFSMLALLSEMSHTVYSIFLMYLYGGIVCPRSMNFHDTDYNNNSNNNKNNNNNNYYCYCYNFNNLKKALDAGERLLIFAPRHAKAVCPLLVFMWYKQVSFSIS